MLLRSRISGAPVVGADGTFLGVFSEKCSMQVLLDAAYDSLPSNEVRAFMDTDARTIKADTDLLTVAQVFLLTTYRRLPVIDDEGRLIGQVSRRDVLQAAMNQIDREPAPESSLLYLSAIFERHEAPLS
jgi:CBS domain-containing protein